MSKHRLKPGFTHHHFVSSDKKGEDGKHVRLKAGDVVELTPAQAEAFSDRFESLEEPKAAAPEPEKKDEPKKRADKPK